MKKILIPLLFLFSSAFLASNSEGFDSSGLQPTAPYGIFSTMGANTPGKGRTAVAFSGEKTGNQGFFRLSTQLAYGVTSNVEFSMSVPYVEDAQGGLEDMTFGLKHRVIGGSRYGLSAAYLLLGSVSSGTDELSTGGSIGAGVALSKRVGPVYGHANLFYTVPGYSQKDGVELSDEVRFSAGMDFSASHDFKILAEFYGRTSHFPGEDQLELRFGYRFLTGKDIFTTLGAGFSIKDSSPEYRLMASLTLLFPRQAVRKVYEEGQ